MSVIAIANEPASLGEKDRLVSDIEAWGSPEQMKLQRTVHRLTRKLHKRPWFVSQGRAPLLLAESMDYVNLVDRILRISNSLFVFCPPEVMSFLREKYSSGGYGYYDASVTRWGGPDTIEFAQDSLAASRLMDAGLQIETLDAETHPARIRQIQLAQAKAGIKPFPGYFMRGADGTTICVALTDEDQDVVGAICAFSLWPGSQYERTAFLAGRFISERWRGKHLSQPLTAACIVEAARRFRSKFFWANNRAQDSRAIRTSFFKIESPGPKRIGLFATADPGN